MTMFVEQISLIHRMTNLIHLLSTHFDPLVGWNAVPGSYWFTRDDIVVVGAEAIVA